MVNRIMKNSFPSIVDPNFTANMESLLDKVADGTVAWKTVVSNFYPDLDEAVQIAEQELESVKIADEVSDEVCDLCGRQMVIKYGPHGKFLACPVSRTARIQSRILRRSVCPVPSAERKWSARRQRRAGCTTGARPIRIVISCHGRNPPTRSALTVVLTWWKRATSFSAPMKPADTAWT